MNFDVLGNLETTGRNRVQDEGLRKKDTETGLVRSSLTEPRQRPPEIPGFCPSTFSVGIFIA